MFTNWIPGLPKQSQKLISASQAFSQQQIRFFLQKIEQYLSEQLGEKIEPQLSQSQKLVTQLTNSLMISSQSVKNGAQNSKGNNSQTMEGQLLATKQKYNYLVNQLDTHNQSMKSILSHIIQLFLSIGQSLQNEDLQTPIQQFQISFQSLNTNKVQKQLKYFYKLYQAALNDYISAKIKAIQKDHGMQIGILKTYTKDIELMLQKQKARCSELNNKFQKISCENSQNLGRIRENQQKNREVSIQQYQKQLIKHQNMQSQLAQALSSLQKQYKKQQKRRKQMQAETSKLNTMIGKMRDNQQTMIEQLQAQLSKKQKSYQQSMSRICHEKLLLQEKINNLTQRSDSLQSQVTMLRKNSHKSAAQNSPLKSNAQKDSKKQLEQKIADLQQNLVEQQLLKRQLVSKQMMKNLFLQFEDESKEWSIKKDIRTQIYLLLGVTVPKSPKKQAKIQEDAKKWFTGFF